VGGVPQTCTPGTPSAEICNGTDDDCDGQTDEALGSTTCGMGACLRTVDNCVGGVPQTCTPGTPSAEICGNGIDEDCDGIPDDGCPDCVDGTSRACYTGSGSTRGVGVCRDGSQFCIGGVFTGPCVGEILPSAEACNGADDDCDGSTDEGLGTLVCGIGACRLEVPACVGGVLGTCVPGTPVVEICNGIDDDCDGPADEDGACPCVYVRPDLPAAGPDCCTGAACLGTPTQPLCTIGEAIPRAMVAGGPRRVCVAANLTGVGACTAYQYDEVVDMQEGLKLHGNHHPTAWTRGAAACVTRIRGQNDRGVYFPPGSTRATEIDGFQVWAREGGIPGPVAAITMTDSSGIVSNCRVEARTVSESYGIDIESGDGSASPLVTASAVGGGTNVTRTAAVRCRRARPEIRNGPAASGELMGGGSIAGETYGIWADRCAGIRVENYSMAGGTTTTGRAAGIRFEGDNSGAIVRASRIWGGTATGAGDAHGIWLASCDGSEPWIVGNVQIYGGGSGAAGTRAYGVYAQTGCDAAIERNEDIAGGTRPALYTRGVACVGGAMCTVQRNTLIRGSWGGVDMEAVGVYCGPDSCRDISRNVEIRGGLINGSVAGSRDIGVWLQGAGPTVDRNFIRGGCTGAVSIGVLLDGAYGRLTNNVITPCVAGPGVMVAAQLHGIQQISSPANANEPDVHSNTIDGGRVPANCTGRAVSILGGDAPLPPRGVYRNNILHAGFCGVARYGLQESGLFADPRIVQNNDFWNANAGQYYNEGTTALNTAVAINGLTDIIAGGNIVGDPLFVSAFADVHLQAVSPCVDAGTATGAPATDMDGESRPFGAGFDIGADERR
ncbi:MAG: MopE-related protein, partial [Myxococcota bacterium]|nr:MopE-related protein [Myxococcota bacterium]